MSAKEDVTRWLGLASYEEKDSGIFYGRDKEVRELSEDIFSHVQTVIYGPSGVGKTSILRAGVFELARKRNFLPVYVRLDVDAEMSYTAQIITAIETEMKKAGAEREECVSPFEDEFSLWEYFHANLFWSSDNYPISPLIVLDQFEELFTLSDSQSRVELFFTQLSDLCDDKMPKNIQKYLNENKEKSPYLDEYSSYRLVFSLREDFLARLEECSVDIPSLRSNRYSLQAVTQEQAMDIILKPGQGIVSEEVAKAIVDKLSYTTAFIKSAECRFVEPSILSLFCNELDKRRSKAGLKMISMPLLQEFGDDIIKEFYEDSIAQISEKSAEYLEDALMTKDGYRDNVALSDAIASGLTEEELDVLKNCRLIKFDEWGGTKRIEFTHDVLCKVAKERREQREELRRLEEERLQNELLTKQLKSKQRKNILLAALVCVLLAMALGTYYAFWMPQKAYFENVVFRYEWPEGVNELTKSQAMERPLSYELTKRGALSKNWTRVTAVNFALSFNEKNGFNTVLLQDRKNEKQMEKLNSVCRWDFVSDGSGNQIFQHKAYDRKGNLVYNFTYTDKNLPEDSLFYYMGFYSDANGYPIQPTKNGANSIKIYVDSVGYRNLIEFFDVWGNKERDFEMVYAYSYKRVDDGALYSQKMMLSKNGKRTYDRSGVSSVLMEYSDDRLIKEWFVDDLEKPTNNKDGYGIRQWIYDEKGRLSKTDYYDKDGNPVLINGDRGLCHMVEYLYDSIGGYKQLRFYDKDKKLKSEGCAFVNIKSDNLGREIETVQYSSDSLPFAMDNGVAGERKMYEDLHNQTLVTTSFNLCDENSVCEDKYGVAFYKYEYDRRGNKLKATCFSEDSCKVNNIYGYSEIVSKYDNDDNMLEQWFYTKEGELVENKNRGCAGLICVYDEKGNLVKESFFDEKRNPKLLDGKVHSIEYEYDWFNNMTKRVYKDLNGNNVKGQLIYARTFDPYGNVVVEECFADDGMTFVNNAKGWQRKELSYDKNKFVSQSVYYDAAGYIVNGPNKGYAIEKIVNDNLGNPVSKSYFSVDMEPAMVNGRHKDSLIYEGAKLKKEIGFDEDNGVVFRATYSYDDNDESYEVSYVNAKGVPCAPFGFAKKTVSYDKDAKTEVLYNAKGKVLKKTAEVIKSEDEIMLDTEKPVKKDSRKIGVIKGKNWIYEGEIMNGKPFGQGRFTWKNGKGFVEGTFNGWDVIVNTWKSKK